MTAVNVVKTSLGKDASGFEKFEVKNADTGEVIGYDLVAPDEQQERHVGLRLGLRPRV